MTQAAFEGIMLLVLTWAAMFSVRAGLFNLALEAEFASGIVASFFAWMFCPSIMRLNLFVAGLGCVVVATIVGGVVGKVYGWLTARADLDPIVCGIALNGAIVPFGAWAYSSWYLPWESAERGGRNLSARIMALNLDEAGLVLCFIVLAAGLSGFFTWWLRNSPKGTRLLASGLSEAAAREAGIEVRRIRLTASVWSGCVCALAGALYVFFVSASSYSTESTMGRGFVALAVSLSARRGVFLVGWLAFVLGALSTLSQTWFRDIFSSRIQEGNIAFIAGAIPYFAVLALLVYNRA